MTFYVENETDTEFSFSVEKTVEEVVLAVLSTEKCPYEAQVNVLLTDNEGIRRFNKEYRGIDKETDVLSFPNINYRKEADFFIPKEEEADCFDPDTKELILGDIILSVDKVIEQAASFGHSQKREFAFLVAHSMFHLCGYDHMTDNEARIMEEKQEGILTQLGITRD